MQLLHFPWLSRTGVQAAVLRLELLDPLLGGNKCFKLEHHLQAARLAGSRGLLSVGGVHSNHLHALAAAGQRLGLETVGLLRGQPQLTPTVTDLLGMGMQLHWLGYGEYRRRHQDDFWAPWCERYPGFYPLPEGGGGVLGARGCARIVTLIEQQLASLGWSDYQQLWLAVGSGTTLAGVRLALPAHREVVGALAVPVGFAVAAQIEQLLQALQCDAGAYRLLDASLGGFARYDDALLRFMAECEAQSGVLWEPVYSAKLLLALRRQIESGQVARGTRLVLLHGGGLQGRRALCAAN